MDRRKFVIGLGSASAAGLGGCIDMVRSEDNPREEDETPTPDDNDSDVEKDDNSDYDGVNEQQNETDVRLGSFKTVNNCAREDPSQFSAVKSQSDKKEAYEFSGRVIVPTSCDDLNADVYVENEDELVIDLSLENATSCPDNCPGAVSFVGTAEILNEELKINSKRVDYP